MCIKHPFSRHSSKCFCFFTQLFLHPQNFCKELIKVFCLEQVVCENVAVVHHRTGGKRMCVCGGTDRFTQGQQSLDPSSRVFSSGQQHLKMKGRE